MPRDVAAIFAHPDDEVLGAGGSLAAHAAAGDRVRILILATGVSARGEGAGKDAIEALRTQGRRAASVLGAEGIDFGDFPDNAMDTVPLLSVVQRVEAFLDDFPASVIYAHHGGDLNLDHCIAHRAVITACRPLPGAPARRILASEVNSSTEWASAPLASFEPTVFADIEQTLEKKVEALACYEGEVRDWPHPRSRDGVRALARWRGAQCGREAAEAFMLIRETASP